MAIPLIPGDRSPRVYFAICKPLEGRDIDDAVAHISRFAAKLGASSAILRNVSGSWAAVFAICKLASDCDDGCMNLPGAAELRSAVRVVEYAWFRLSSEMHRDTSLAKLSVGDIVSVRRIYSERATQEVLAYSCLAVMKAYFNHIKGIESAAFYRSTDGNRIIGLGLWDSAQSAFALVNNCRGSPGEAYWEGLGAKMLKYDVCQVVYLDHGTA